MDSRRAQLTTLTETVRSRGRSSKSSRTTCCQVPSASRPPANGNALRRAHDRRAQVGVGVGVVVEAVVLVVARARDQALEGGLEVAHAAGLVLHGRDRGGRAGHEHGHHAAVGLGLLHHAAHPLGEVDDVAVALGRQPQEAAVDGHARLRSRTNRRRPACSTAPSSRSAGRSGAVDRLAVDAHAALGQHAAGLRARDAERVGEHGRQVDLAVVAGIEVGLGHVVGRLVADHDPLEVRRGSLRGLLAVEAHHQPARELVLGVEWVSAAGGDAPSSRSHQVASASSGIDIVLPYISSGASVTPMSLPSDLDIFCSPSVPGSSGTSGSPARPCRRRAGRRAPAAG